jgi:recombination protein RecT
MCADDMAKWAKKYSKAYANPKGPWQKEPDAMGIKTCLRKLLGKYGVMSIEFAQAMSSEDDDMADDQRFNLSAGINANTGEIIDIDPVVDQSAETGPEQRGPGF